MELYQIWLIAALFFLIIEIFTAGFAIACLSVGCVFSAIGALYDISMSWQVGLFAIGTTIAFITIRPLVLRLLEKNTKDVKSNIDSIIGRTAIVSVDIEANGFGRVKLDGDDWKAQSEDGSAIGKGTKVIIISNESIILTVKQQ